MDQDHSGRAVALSDLEQVRALLTDFAWFADRGDGAGLADLFLEDGTLSVGGQELAGREAIAQDCLRRAAVQGRKARHLWSNLRIERADAQAIATSAVQLTFEQVGTHPAQLRVNDLSDAFRKDALGQWRIARRVIRREMALSF